jgi:hypothetical protein
MTILSTQTLYKKGIGQRIHIQALLSHGHGRSATRSFSRADFSEMVDCLHAGVWEASVMQSNNFLTGQCGST